METLVAELQILLRINSPKNRLLGPDLVHLEHADSLPDPGKSSIPIPQEELGEPQLQLGGIRKDAGGNLKPDPMLDILVMPAGNAFRVKDEPSNLLAGHQA